MYVLDQWLKTQYTYKQDIQASLLLIKPKILKQKLIVQAKVNKMFPQFEQMLKLSQSMIQIISRYKVTAINDVMIGKELNKVVSFFKIYLEYFKNKSEMKSLFEEMEKNNPKELKAIEKQLQEYFEKVYENKSILEGKPKGEFKNPKTNITIHDCLQRPLYRLFKYHLLLDNYMKKLPKQHPDYVQLKKTRELFSEIGEKCNNSITEQEKQELKFKLEQLYGRSLPQSSQYKTMMSADTLYFSCKLYIFSNLIIISKAEKLIGFRQEKLYMNLGIDQFSFITYKSNLKYFKNILLLCGIYECIHFFLPEKGTRLQIYQLIGKIIQEQKMKAFKKRQHKQIKPSNKLMFTLDQKQSYRTWLTGLRIQVVDIDMRALGVFTSDTAFILSISIPEYIDDEATFLKTSRKSTTSYDSKYTDKNIQLSNKNDQQNMTKQQQIMVSRIGPVNFKKSETSSQIMGGNKYCALNQHLQIHLSELIKIQKKLIEDFPEIKFPQIDPLSKDFNFYSESKKKTKSFEVRAFLIQEFFNFVFRHPSIMEYPLKILNQLRVDENIWNYVAERSLYLQDQKRNEKSEQTPGNKYDQNHCQHCKLSVIQNIAEFQILRLQKLRIEPKSSQNYCFNFYNLLRNNLLGLPHTDFTVSKDAALFTLFEGRMDYAFLYKKNLAKKCKFVNILIPRLIQPSKREQNEGNSIFHIVCQIPTDHKTTVGMVVNSISKDIQIFNMLDYRLVIQFNNQERILDQDEYIYDLINKYELDSEEKTLSENESQIVGPRNSIREDSFAQTTMGFFSMIKNVLPTINKNKSIIYLRKMIYFPLHIQMESVAANFQRSKLLVIEILQKISKLNISVSLQVWGDLCGLYYSLLSVSDLSRMSMSKEIFKSCLDILPQEKYDLIKNKIFTERMQNVLLESKKSFNTQSRTIYLSKIHQKIIQIAYRNFKVNTYFVPVTAKTIPKGIVLQDKIIEGSECFIGVNQNEVIVVRDKKNPIQAIRIPLEDVQIVHSVYSLFLTYKRQTIEQEKDQIIQEFQLRFDNKMLHGFVQLCEKYRLLKSKFGALYSDFELSITYNMETLQSNEQKLLHENFWNDQFMMVFYMNV